jgi:NUMOD4 motif
MQKRKQRPSVAKPGVYHQDPWRNTSLDDIIGELWAAIPGYEGMYEASTFGRIKKLPRVWDCDGYMLKTVMGIVTQVMNQWGYVYVELADINKKRKKWFAHVLAAKTFIQNPGNKPTVNHKLGIKHDNRISELEWNTRSENQLHGYRLGLLKVNKTALGKKGSLCPHSIPINQYSKEGVFIRRWSGATEAAQALKLSPGNVWSALNGKYKTTGGFIWKYENK